MPTNAPGEAQRREAVDEAQYERWTHWPVNWSAVWVGALSALAAVILFGLIGVALGAHFVGSDARIVDLKKVGLATLAFSVFSSFFAFVIGGWVATKIAGILRAEPGMLHGAITWALSLPLLVVLIALGAGSSMGGWYAAVSGTPTWGSSANEPFERPDPVAATATESERAQYRVEMTEYRAKVKQWREDAPKAARNSALGAVTALLLGLVGSVIGGWMACGEPMTFTHHRTRPSYKPGFSGLFKPQT